MCYDVAFTAKTETIVEKFPEIIQDEQLIIHFDATVHIQGHAFREQPIIYRNRDDLQLHLKLMEWGCIPFYVREEAGFVRQRLNMLNARSERIWEDKTSYWYKIRERRCLVPVTGIYEHREIKGWKNKVPYFISWKQEPMFFLPGLYSVVELPDKSTGELIKRFTFTIITRTANSLMQQIHNGGDNAGRMPLFLPIEMAKEWVDELTEARYKEILAYELPSSALDQWPVFSIRTTKPHPEHKQKNEPFLWPELPELVL
jgi:putative SOS response-associated peptidase YedK